MNRSKGLICGIVVFVCTTVLAQHRGSQGAAGPTSGKTSNSDDLHDFKRAVALQASPDQVSQFKELVTSTQAARKATQELLQLSAKAGNPDLSHSTENLPSAVEDVQADSEKFLRSFTKMQQSELKKITKKLEKANSEMSRESKALGPAASNSDGKQIASVAEKLDKALGDFAAAQDALANEMGIPQETTSQ
jgi:HPt (histidine-containing phosphotransfer) domain-containing protein